jgi:hypothetical protein
LPKDSAIAERHLHGWSNTEELLAIACELIDQSNRLFFQANSKKGSKPPKPIEIRRPGRDDPSPTSAETGRRRQATSEELRAFFGGAARYTGPKGAT